MNWDDFRILAAVNDQGTYAGASAKLRIDETTVARRVARIQKALGVALFEAADGVRKPTPACATILAHVREIARHAAEIGTVGKQAQGVVGRFRIASTSAVAEEILAPRVAQFLVANPGLTLHFTASDDNVNFSRWEADLAVRLRKPARGDFTIAKLADIRLFLIAPAGIADAADAPVICCFPDDLDGTEDSRYLMAEGLHARGRCISASYRVARGLVRTGMATAVLPEHVCGDLLDNPALRATPLAERHDVWLLVQNHLRRDPAARMVIDWVRDCFRAFSAR